MPQIEQLQTALTQSNSSVYLTTMRDTQGRNDSQKVTFSPEMFLRKPPKMFYLLSSSFQM